MSKFQRKKGKGSQKINTASLPDIVFMLLFFFMVATTMRETEVQVRVTVHQATAVMYQLGDFQHVFFKKAECIGIGEHQAGHFIVGLDIGRQRLDQCLSIPGLALLQQILDQPVVLAVDPRHQVH